MRNMTGRQRIKKPHVPGWGGPRRRMDCRGEPKVEGSPAEETPAAEHDRLMDILECMHDQVYIIASDYHIEYLNPAAVRAFGPHERSKCYEYFHGAKEPCDWCMMKQVLEGENVRWEWTSPKNARTYEVFDSAFHNRDGTVAKLGILHDITAYRKAVEGLRKSEAKYRNLIEKIPAITYTAALDKRSAFTFVSPQIETILGFSKADCQADPDLWLKRLHPGDRDRVLAEVSRCEADGRPFVSEYRMIRKDGKVVWFRDEAEIIDDGRGAPLMSQGVMFDISGSKTAEQALKNQLYFLETLIRTIPLPVYYKNRQGIYIGCNRAFETFLGLSRDQIIGKTVREVTSGAVGEKYHEMDMALFERPGLQSYEYTVLSADGTAHDVIFYKSTFHDSTGEVAGLTGVILEITERKKSDEALRRSERELRFLSSRLLTAQEEERKRIARELHDSIGSSLAAIKIALHNQLSTVEKPDTAMGRSLERLVLMTQQAIQESRRIVTDLRPSILDDLGILTTIKWFCGQFVTLHPGIRVEPSLHAKENQVPESLKIVIFRVLQEAMNNIGKYSKASVVTLSLVANADGIVLTIADNGTGFDPNELVKNGADISHRGFGLTSMRERVEFSGGTFSIRSDVNRGTTIRASWPTT